MSCGVAVEEWSSSGKVEQAVVSEVALDARVQKVVKLEWILIGAILFWLFPIGGKGYCRPIHTDEWTLP